MAVDALFSSMPPSRSAWIFLRRRRILALALTLSVVLHAFAYLATPYFIRAWREPAEARFDATLVPIAESQIEKTFAPKTIASRPRRASKLASPKPVRAPKTNANFVAPKNAIAVAKPREDGDETGGIAVAVSEEKAPVAAETRPGTTAPLTTEAVAPAIAVVVEKPDPTPTELPSRIVIAYQMSSSISDGVADYTWTRNGQQFEIDSTMQATGFIIGNFVGVLHQISRGVVTPAGLRPRSFHIRRGDGAPDSAEFLHQSNELKLTRGGDQVRTVPLAPQLQDMQSFLFQLAYDAPKLQTPDDRLDVMVTNARKVYRHRFRQVGIETVRTRAGTVQTVHLRSESADPEDTYEVWLAPGNYHLPVKLKFYAGRFPVELIATSIRTTP